MALWRGWASVALLLALAGGARAQTHSLAEALQAGDYFRVQLEMRLEGEIRVAREGAVVPLKLLAEAKHAYPERILQTNGSGLAIKSARFYETAAAVIQVDGDKNEKALRAERRLLVAQRHKDQFTLYCPAGPLTRGELELTSEHLDTLAITGVLPGKDVAVGDTWKLTPAVAQALCGFEGLTNHELMGKLDDVKDGVAFLRIEGGAGGIDRGALVKITVRGNGRFDLQSKRLTFLEWTQKDERDQGPASPASTMTASTRVTRTPSPAVAALSDVALVSVPDGLEVNKGQTQLVLRDPKNRYELVHGREWQQVGQSGDYQILRLLDRGDFIAQVSITPWPKTAPGKHATPEEFQQAMARTPGWELQETLQVGEIPSDAGRWVFRASALGMLDGLRVVQTFYLVAGPKGDQLLLTFLMTPKQADKLGTRDLEVVGGVSFLEKSEANQPSKTP